MAKTKNLHKPKVSYSQISTGFVSKMAKLRNYRILILNLMGIPKI